MSSLDFIKKLAAGETSDAKEEIFSDLSTKAFEALDARKQEVAKNIFSVEENTINELSYDKLEQYKRAAGYRKAWGKQEDGKISEETILEAKKLISKHGAEGDVHTAKVYRDPEYNEYQVHYYKNGKHMGEGPVGYHDDKEDAQSTAELELARMNAK